jgi:hypothetical protein
MPTYGAILEVEGSERGRLAGADMRMVGTHGDRERAHHDRASDSNAGLSVLARPALFGSRHHHHLPKPSKNVRWSNSRRMEISALDWTGEEFGGLAGDPIGYKTHPFAGSRIDPGQPSSEEAGKSQKIAATT